MYENLKYIKKMAPSLILAIFFVAIDRFLKIYALKKLDSEHISLIGDWLNLSLARNTGIAFSLGFSFPILKVAITLILVLLLVYWIDSLKNQKMLISQLLVFTIFGAISNLFDRYVFGFVVDYIDLKYFTVFNVADMMIVISVLILFVFELKKTDAKTGF